MIGHSSHFEHLKSKTGKNWAAITKSKQETEKHVTTLRELIANERPPENEKNSKNFRLVKIILNVFLLRCESAPAISVME
ncbi:hypothetical protein MNBD_PLANCTO02-3363 [hydrothermal vent metagenome]|uniref:Uncharacterized protein n=1 Tax=hydrothermal vent metagenome TaxID=652676 RepID=A0A3B1D1H1_9ZZZZ